MPPETPATIGLTTAGWFFLVVSVAFVTILCARCFYRVLTTSDEPPPEPVKDFHSA